MAGIIGGLALAFYTSGELRYDLADLRQVFLALGAAVSIYSAYFLAYSITVLASVRKNKTGQYDT